MNRLIVVLLLAAVACSGSNVQAPPALSKDATLSSLKVSAGSLSPAFSSSTHSYSLAVPAGTGAVKVMAVPTDAKALSVGVRQDNLALFAVDSVYRPPVGSQAADLSGECPRVWSVCGREAGDLEVELQRVELAEKRPNFRMVGS